MEKSINESKATSVEQQGKIADLEQNLGKSVLALKESQDAIFKEKEKRA